MDNEKIKNFTESIKKLAREQGLECIVVIVDNEDQVNKDSKDNGPTFWKFFDFVMDHRLYIALNNGRISITEENRYPQYILDLIRDDTSTTIRFDNSQKYVLSISKKSSYHDNFEYSVLTMIVNTDDLRFPETVRIIPGNNKDSTDDIDSIYVTLNGSCEIPASTSMNNPEILNQLDSESRSIFEYICEKLS